MPSNLCQFCGAAKDAQGRCLCSVEPAAGSVVPTGAPPTTASLGPVVPSVGSGPRLTVIEGPHAGAVFDLAALPITVGREEGRAIHLSADRAVSRRHARIEAQMGAVVVIDEGSANGTYVNGVRIESQALAPGDVVQMGATKLVYSA